MQGEELKEFSVTPEPMYDIKWIITPNAPPIFRSNNPKVRRTNLRLLHMCKWFIFNFSKLVKMHSLISQLLFLQGTWNLLTNESYWL